MCLSTVYKNRIDEDCVAATYIEKINIEGNDIELTDIMGTKIHLEGKLIFADLSEGVVLVNTDE